MPASGTLKWKIMSLTHHPDGRTEYTPGSEPGSPWENGYPESFNGKLRDELLSVEILDTLRETQVLVARWPREYNMVRPHSALNYRPPAPAKGEKANYWVGRNAQ